MEALLDNLMLAGAPRWLETRARRDDLLAECQSKLRDELLQALATDPQRVVMTPAFGVRKYTAADVVLDTLDGKDGQPLHELLKMIAAAAAGEDIQLRAVLWTQAQAKKHAAYHADDMVLDIEDNA